MKEFPYWKSKRSISAFVRKNADWYLKLDESLTGDQLTTLFRRHVPAAFGLDIVANIIDHRNCPRPLINMAEGKLRRISQELSSAESALALRAELSPEAIEQLIERQYCPDVIDHAIGTLSRQCRDEAASSSYEVLKRLSYYPFLAAAQREAVSHALRDLKGLATGAD